MRKQNGLMTALKKKTVKLQDRVSKKTYLFEMRINFR